MLVSEKNNEKIKPEGAEIHDSFKNEIHGRLVGTQ